MVASAKPSIFSSPLPALVSAGMFMRRFMATIAFVAPRIASPMACVDFSVANLNDTACNCALHPCNLVTECRLRTRDVAMTRTASIWPSVAAF